MLLLAAALLFATQTADGARTPRPAESPAARFDSTKHAATPDEQREIAKLVDDLLLIDKPDFGLAPTMSGSQFAPVPSSRSFLGGIIMIDHGLETSHALRRLVELGPKAIPALLRVLDDESPTKLVVKQDEFDGAMWYGQEVPTNPVHPRELEASKKYPFLAAQDQAGGIGSDRIPEHKVTRGDVAFVTLGQIVGRNYQASRYQPTMCHVINSPSHDKTLAAALRAIWSSEDPAKMLFESLLVDYIGGGESDPFQSGAVMRLAYYFPAESRSFLVPRIDTFDVHDIPWMSEGYEEGWRKQEEANGGDSRNFVASLAWCEDPAIVDAIGRVLERTDQRAMVVACLGAPVAKAKSDLVIKKIGSLLATLPDAQPPGPFGDEYNLLRGAVEYLPDRARPLFETWLKHGTLDCRRAVVHALSDLPTRLPWAVEVLAPLLDDKTDTSWEYGPDYRRRPIRVCDEAAHALTSHVANTNFELDGDEANLDAQIAEIRRAIAGLPPLAKPKSTSPAVEFESVAAREPIASISSDLPIVHVHDFSDAKTIYAAIGYESEGWAWDTATFDVATTKLVLRTKFDHWRSAVVLIPPVAGERLFCYHPREGGHIVVRDARSGSELQRIQTPFHGGVSFDDPLQVRGLSDIFATDDGAWLIALTLDGALHAIDTKKGEHSIVWRRPAHEHKGPEHGELTPMIGTSRSLISFFGASEPLRIWDQATAKMSELENVPRDAWIAAWGKYACRNMNSVIELWDLEACEPVKLGLPKSEVIASVTCDPRAALAVISTADSRAYVFDLRKLQPVAALNVPRTPGEAAATFSADRRSLFWVVYPPRDRSTGDHDSIRTTQITVFDVSDLTR